MHAAVQLGVELVAHRSLEDEPEDLPVCTQSALLLDPTFLPTVLADLLV